ncbi:MAG: hypothetical protein WDN28_22265 [Chthoniobacter sp.]
MATIYGARQRLKIVGIALSPEYVFEARPGETLPDNKRFGVFWMNERDLAKTFKLDGAFNNVLVKVAPGANPLSVMADLDRLLAPYGGLVAYARRLRPARPPFRAATERRTARVARAVRRLSGGLPEHRRLHVERRAHAAHSLATRADRAAQSLWLFVGPGGTCTT